MLAVLVVAAELYAPFKSSLASAFMHHWVGKLVLVSLVFFATAYVYRNKTEILGVADGRVGWFSVLGSLAAILLFYVVEFVM
ncbi:MAG: hypothetical protein HY366_00950 [Candidatus Aenigmarchaeota archaeon]|nr:hypothetical protein [Candidatus Aenigmarchaeota archaeon]